MTTQDEVTSDGIKVVFVCGDPAIYVGNQRVAKVSRASPEGEALIEWANAKERTFAKQGQRALSFMGGSVLVTPTHAEFVFREDDLQWDDEPGVPYRWLRIPAGDYQELGAFLTRDSDGTASAALCEDIAVPQDCQARAVRHRPTPPIVR